MLTYWIEHSEKLQSFRVIQKAIIGCSGFAGKDVVILNKNSSTHLMKSIIQTSCSKPAINPPTGSNPSNFNLRQYKPSDPDLGAIFVKVLFPNATLVSNRWGPWPLSLISIIPKSLFVVSTPFDAVHFVMCAPLQQRKFLSLLGYISAFDLVTWMVILFSVILSVSAWNRIVADNKKTSFSAVFILKILLGQSTNKIQNVRLITGAWVFAGLFLTNNYKGNNIDQLTSPFSPKKFETFGEILANNFTVYSLPIWYEVIKSEMPALLSSLRPNEVYTHYNKFYWNTVEVTFGKMYPHQKSRNGTDELEELLKRIAKIPANLSEMQNMIPFGYYVDAISKRKFDVFADTMSFIQKLRSNLLKAHIEDTQVSQSKVAFGQMFQFWEIAKLQVDAEDYARRRFGLIESGIIYLWNGWKNRLESWNDTVEAEKLISSAFKPISIEGNVVVVFYIDLAFKLACLCVFLCECVKYLKISICHVTGIVLTELKSTCVRCFVGLKSIVEALKI